ncbi:MAG: hypothetical protein RLZZ293_394 [Pseudomonadota bacterium]|jgi:bis(5'-nucleosyl)-tetraphosphatase (symmetrical)
MARYAIGDIQGCYAQFMKLLEVIDFNPSKDILYLVGDLVNRGPNSLEVLKWVYKNQDQVISVLGNHDIYLLARFNNLVKADHDDTLNSIINDKNAGKYIDWLRTCPLIYHDNEYILSHAGVYPYLSFNQMLHLNHAISNHFKKSNYVQFIHDIFGNKPNYWSDEYPLLKQMKFLINATTRMRFLERDSGALDYKYKGELSQMPPHLMPWFQSKFHPSISKKIIFGHWAALGFFHEQQFIALDTGCVWGRKLTAINLENYELNQVCASI